MSTSTDEKTTNSSTESVRPMILIGAGIAFGVTFWSAVVVSAVFLWLWFNA